MDKRDVIKETLLAQRDGIKLVRYNNIRYLADKPFNTIRYEIQYKNGFSGLGCNTDDEALRIFNARFETDI